MGGIYTTPHFKSSYSVESLDPYIFLDMVKNFTSSHLVFVSIFRTWDQSVKCISLLHDGVKPMIGTQWLTDKLSASYQYIHSFRIKYLLENEV